MYVSNIMQWPHIVSLSYLLKYTHELINVPIFIKAWYKVRGIFLVFVTFIAWVHIGSKIYPSSNVFMK